MLEECILVRVKFYIYLLDGETVDTSTDKPTETTEQPSQEGDTTQDVTGEGDVTAEGDITGATQDGKHLTAVCALDIL